MRHRLRRVTATIWRSFMPRQSADRCSSCAPGNSGGPLVDAEGKLVGNSMIVGGLDIAIPAGVVLAFVTRTISVRAA